MTAKQIVAFTLAWLPNVALAKAPKVPPAPRVAPVSIQGSWAGIKFVGQLVREYESERGSHFIKFLPRDSNQVPAALKKHECDVGMMLDSLASGGKEFQSQFEAFSIGRFVVHVAVNAKAPVYAMTLQDLRDVFRGKTTSWKDVSGVAGRIELYAPLSTAPESSIFQKKVMRGAPYAKELRDRSATPPRQKLSAAEVIAAIAKQSGAIGFFLHDPGEKLDKRVRVLRIAMDKDSKAVPPSVESVADGSYPLTDTFTLYLHPDAPTEARAFCEYAAGSKGMKTVGQFGLWPEPELEKTRQQQRLAQRKAKRGDAIPAAGNKSAEPIVAELATQFTKSRQAVQIEFKAASTADALAKLVAGDVEMIVLDDPLAATALEADARFAALKTESAVLGRRAIGVVIHPTATTREFTMADLTGIWSGEIAKWPDSGKPIKLFATKSDDPGVLFLGSLFAARPTAAMVWRGGTAQVVQSVQAHAGSIGFVDLGQLGNRTRAALAAVLRASEKAEAPTDGKIPNDYPLCWPVTLYVSPSAGEVAKEILTFAQPSQRGELSTQLHLFPPMITGAIAQQPMKARKPKAGKR